MGLWLCASRAPVLPSSTLPIKHGATRAALLKLQSPYLHLPLKDVFVRQLPLFFASPSFSCWSSETMPGQSIFLGQEILWWVIWLAQRRLARGRHWCFTAGALCAHKCCPQRYAPWSATDSCWPCPSSALVWNQSIGSLPTSQPPLQSQGLLLASSQHSLSSHGVWLFHSKLIYI